MFYDLLCDSLLTIRAVWLFMVFNGCSVSGHCMHHVTHMTLNQVKMLSVSMCFNIHWMHVWFLASDFFTECCCHAFLVTCHFQKFLDFSAVKMATHEELITPKYTLFCPFNSLTTIERINTVRASNFSKHIETNQTFIP